MLRRSVKRTFEVDRYNEPILRQLYLYFTNDPACGWNLNAGIIFGGKLGCGKSLMMMAYLGISDQYSRKLTTQVHSKTLCGLIKQNGIETYVRRPLFIDELGREESEVKDYGNIVKPVIDLFGLRYEEGARTYATTNFNYNSLQNFYSEYIRTRMEEMMTYVQFTGESRRLKNEVKTR
jgi:DNA replication protein DnaC